ncbi:beta-phosphoglucomutase [Pedobacter sp. CG_S7]|uniref:beta-phosphoglucomutase n=1 Tax=Pedobacter sp. CG_S7 TaxID=3143930 RepID=UPI003390A730
MQEPIKHQSSPAVACIFDLDGVLVDTAVYHFQAWKKLANSLGFDFTEAQNENLKGVNRMRSLDMILNWGGVDKSAAEKETLAATKNEWYVAMINKMTAAELLPGTVQLLADLKKEGVKIALGSASKNSAVILERTQLTHFFDAIVDGNVVSASKPDPEVFTTAAAMLGVPVASCIVFEDAQVGVEAAIAGKMKVVAVGTAANLKGANRYVKDLSEITVQEIMTLIKG